MKLLCLAASLREGSWNRKLLSLAMRSLDVDGVELDVVPYREFVFEAYDADVKDRGFPDAVVAAGERIAAADGLVIASPEYNSSMSGNLKNTIDWISRLRPMPFRGRSGLLLSASTSVMGGIRGLWHLRQPIEGLGVYLHPEMFALAKAPEAFAEDGTLRDEALGSRLEKLVASYLTMAEALRTR